MPSSALPSSEIIVIGAGIVGLSIALELRMRGAQVAVLERNTALSHASTAAAGMLAAGDPHNPPELRELSDFSLTLYDEFLRNIRNLSGFPVPYQTTCTMQYAMDKTHTRLQEHSLDPRQLAPALLRAVVQSGVDLQENTHLNALPADRQIVHATGAWAERFHARPRKGQMLRVQLPKQHEITEVHRAEHIYVVPRTEGPQAGTALIGATVEDAGFDVSVRGNNLAELRHIAADLHASLKFLGNAPLVEAWAGLRPATPDNLPIIGRISLQELVATGHFRNGILLAPATAKVVADLVEGHAQTVRLDRFSHDRFG